MGPAVMAGIPHLSQLCLNKLANTFNEMCGNLFSCCMLQKSPLNTYIKTYTEMCRNQFSCCQLEKSLNTYNEMCGNQFRCCKLEKSPNMYTNIYENTIFSSVGSYTFSDSVLYLYMLLQQNISGGCVYALGGDSFWGNVFHVLFMIENTDVIDMAVKLCRALVCRDSNCLQKPRRGEEMKAHVLEDSTDNIDRAEIASVQDSADKGSASFIVSGDLSTDCKGSKNQKGDGVLNCTSVVENNKQTTENGNEVSMFDVLYLGSNERKLETEQDISTSDALLDRKPCGKDIDNEVLVTELYSLDSKKYELDNKGDMVIDDNMIVDISLLKGLENIILPTVHQDVCVTNQFLKKSYNQMNIMLQTIHQKPYNQMIKYETCFQSVTAIKQNFTEDMDVTLHIYGTDCSATTVHSGFRFETGLRLSRREHGMLPLVQKLCHLYDLLQVYSTSDYRSELLMCEFIHDSDCCYFTIKIARTKQTDSERIKRIHISRINRAEIRRIKTTSIAIVKGTDISIIKGVDTARINNAVNRKLIMCDKRLITDLHLLSSRDLHIQPLANNKNYVLSNLVSLLLPGDTAKPSVTKLEKPCSIYRKKIACTVNNCQMASRSSISESLTYTDNTSSEHNNMEESSSVCKSGSNLQIRFHADKADHVEAQMSHENADHIEAQMSHEKMDRVEARMSHENADHVEAQMSHEKMDRVEAQMSHEKMERVEAQMSHENIDHVEARMSHENTDHVLFSFKPLSGKRLSVLLKNQHGRNVEGERSSSSSDILESIRLKKLWLQIEIEILDCFTPSQALRNVCVNMLPPVCGNMLPPVCGIPWKEFERETMRLASFAKYPASAAKSAANLASCGFVYVGNGTNDKVKCYFCSVEKESWEMNDNIDEIHKSLSPSCPLVIVQFSNNVASNMSSPDLGNARGNSSSGPHTSESPQPVAVSNSVSSSQSTSSGRGRSGYDDVDYRRTNASGQPTTEASQRQSSTSRRVAAIASSLRTDANGSINTPRSSTHTPILPVLRMGQQDSSSAVRNNMINHGSQHFQNSDSLNEEAIRNLQNGSSANQDNVSHHPNINTQVYAIPPGSNGVTVADTSNSAQTQSQLTYQLLGIFHERPKFPNFAVLARRLQSFEGWPEQHPIKREDLVKSGLFFAGYGDCCKCFFCGGGLRNWENGDNAYVEHARWFDKCSYIRQFMGLEFVEAVTCLKNRGGTITFKDVTDYMQTKGQSIQNLFNDKKISDDVAVRSLVDAGYNVEDVSRAALSLRESGELLSADVILRKMREQQSQANGATAEGATASETTNPDDFPDEGRLQALKEQNYALRSNLTCKICMDKEVKIVFLPCGHLISCQECAVALQDCPLCRSHIRARARANIN